MAGVCGNCQILRLTSTLKGCFNTKFLPFKPKYTIPATFVSTFSFLGYRRSSENRPSGGFIWQHGRRVPEDICTFWKLKGSRSYRSTSFHFQRDVEEPVKTKPVSGIIKTKLEKMKEMKEDIYTVPNLLSTFRILITPVLGYLIVTEDFVSSLLFFGVAGVTDMLDGFIARNFKNQKSVLGTVLDPFADKILMSVLTISLTVVSLLPVTLTALILSRDALLIGYAFYLRYKSLPSPKTISRYFDFNLPTVELRPNFLGKANTVLQLALVGCSLAAPVFGFVDHPHLQYLCHIKEHLKEEIEFKEEEMSDEDLQFHYFRLHDYDGNRKLDGLEIMHAISHYQNESGVTDKEETSEEANSRTVDQILDEDDLNSDGYIDYPEYIASHKTSTKDSEGHAN
ncbi:unnamed protein product [Pocillopora meandrina]|uniref:cardiolipin synthase (CMP-forming) n=1 Tax=Pocillopora meandrina TaxID=46732 RepID=A0AAU9W1R9_9CNID|nr:unnamed protein product [Pocillopora meandrina]